MLTTSIVLFNTNKSILKKVLDCTIASNCVSKIYLIDNSPDRGLESFNKYSPLIEYIFNGKNIGYGSAHNIVMKKAIAEGSRYHLILNPDVRFEKDVLKKCLDYMEINPDVGYILPKVTYPNGNLQYLCKLLPTPTDLIFRRFIPSVGLLKKWKKKINDKYVLKKSGYNRIINPPCLSGCFMLLRLSTITQYDIFFDERYFMYCEDFDLMRRLHRVSKTIFYPEVSIIHDHAQESYHSKAMLRQHIKSICVYFNKYGWFLDKERSIMNKRILNEIKSDRVKL
jgi:GT2 family glycosyltransferase